MFLAVKLERLFRTTDWAEGRLARAAEANQSTINRLRRNKRLAGLGLALRIERATDGLVRAEDVPMSTASRRDLLAIRGNGGAGVHQGAAA